MPHVVATVRNVAGLTATAGADILITEPPPVSGRVPLTMTLDFGGGNVLAFDESAATDIGDYVGPFVHQRCLRQVRGDILVDFRPDGDGKRDEVVIELGTLHAFPAGSPPKPASGNAPAHIMVPPTPKVTAVAGSPSVQTGNYNFITTYVTPEGESAGARYSYLTLAAGQRVSVASPPPAGDATGYNVYASPASGVLNYVRQNAQPIPFGTNWTAPDTGLLSSGVTYLPGVRPSTVAYTATISGGTLAAPVTIKVPVHYWSTRWRYQSAPRPIVRRYADLVAMKAILPLDRTLAYTPLTPMVPRPWAGPMDIGPVSIGMPGTGERPDIGFIPEWTAQWLLTGDAGAESRWRSAAEATGTMAFWVRDAATGALFDTVQRPYVSYNDAANGPYRIPVASQTMAGNVFQLDASHMPACALVPYLLTDDPYFLEGAQATGNYGISESNLYSLASKIPGQVDTLQARAMAWGWRDVFQLALATPDTTPAWLLPRSYWHDKLVPAQLKFANLYLANNASPCTSVFKLMPDTNTLAAFMQQYICTVAGWIKWTGQFPEFDPVLEYVATPQLALCDPTDARGWDHRWPIPYYPPVVDARKAPNSTGAPNLHWKAVSSPDTPTSWGELFQCTLKLRGTARGNEVGVPATDPPSWPADGLINPNSTYLPWTRCSLAALSLAGLPGARAAHDWLKAQLDKHPVASSAKWAVPPT